MKRGDPVRVAAGIALLAGALAAAAPSRAQPVPEAVTEGETPEDEQRAVWDPWQPMNRGIFAFNEFIDRYLLEPVATGWDVVVPDPAQRGIANFFANAAAPRRIANDLLQGKLDKAGDDFGRFAINTTFGVLGLFDPAGAEGIAPGDEDFGQTLGVWGTPAGPYLVLPLLGPSSPRDAAGLAADIALCARVLFRSVVREHSRDGYAGDQRPLARAGDGARRTRGRVRLLLRRAERVRAVPRQSGSRSSC